MTVKGSTSQGETLLVVGASARAAAFSALRAGYEVRAVDLFADADLANCAEVWQASDYPQGLVVAAQQAPPGAWLYTGGLENHPDAIAAISETRELLGNPPAALREVRDPRLWREACRAADVPTVPLLVSARSPINGAWLRKPLRSSGGGEIVLYEGPPYPPVDENHYWEAFQSGVSQSAVYVANPANAQRVQLLGVTEQLNGVPWAGAYGFQYSGSIGPLSLSPKVHAQYLRLGEVLGRNLRGLFGIDTIVTDDGRVLPVEINPRYPASLEVLERALGYHALAWHVAACREQPTPDYEFPAEIDCEPTCGKVIVYAEESITIDDEFSAACLESSGGPSWPQMADIPRGGTTIEPGQPVMTLFAAGKCTESVRQQLQAGAAAFY